MSLKKITELDIIKMSDKNYSTFKSLKNKIHEEIKENVINRFIKKIYEQQKEIIDLKYQLENVIKHSLIIIKKCLQKKNLYAIKEISFSYINGNSNLYHERSIGKNMSSEFKPSIIRNAESLTEEKKSQKNRINDKSHVDLNLKILKKYLNPKLSLVQNSKITPINKNNILFKYRESLNSLNGMKYKNKTRNNLYNNSTFFSEKQNETFFIDKDNLRIEPINNSNLRKIINISSFEKKDKSQDIINKYKNNHVYAQHSFFAENNIENGKDKNLYMNSSKGDNRIRLLKKSDINKLSSIKKNTAKYINSINKFNMMRNNHNLSNNILNYYSTEKSDDKIKSIFSEKKNAFSHSYSKTNEHEKLGNNNMLTNAHMSAIGKLNEIILKMKEMKKSSPDIQNIPQKKHKVKKKINICEANKTNIPNFTSVTERFSEGKHSFNNGHKKNGKEKRKKNMKYHFENKKVENAINIQEINYGEDKYDNSFQTIYNPTFTSFLNRKDKDENGESKK
jgi:hypothetical protein